MGRSVGPRAVKHLLEKYAEVFETGPGTMKHIKAQVFPPRDVPYAIRDVVEEAGMYLGFANCPGPPVVW